MLHRAKILAHGAATPLLPDAYLASMQNGHSGHGSVTACAFHVTDPTLFLGAPSLTCLLSAA